MPDPVKGLADVSEHQVGLVPLLLGCGYLFCYYCESCVCAAVRPEPVMYVVEFVLTLQYVKYSICYILSNFFTVFTWFCDEYIFFFILK